ncbi:MAG TPA: LLM class flavin-dependent oxidoreductase, partial [Solirubrobacterales bacterium]|nr:LLM class flavin-dependent oxidoreductase [Solirubrobacterales bacterium]
LEQITWAEKTLGFDAVYLTEHHFAEDGYSPSLFTIAGAISQRTEKMLIGTNLVQLPLHHPLRIAEEALTVDILSGGRFRLGVGNGYRGVEFEALGTSLRYRKARVEEGVPILRKAFAGEPFAHEGKHFTFPEVLVTPLPIRPGGPGVWMGGQSEPAIDRAARLADGFLAVSDEDVRRYLEALERNGRTLEEAPINRVYWGIVAEDPERELATVGKEILYQVNKYIEWGFLGDVAPYDDPRKVIEDGTYRIWDGDEAVRDFTEHHRTGVSEFQLFAALPGEDLDNAAERVEFVANKVIPRVREAIGEDAVAG